MCLMMSLFPVLCHYLRPSNLVSTGMESNNLLACRSGAVGGFRLVEMQTALQDCMGKCPFPVPSVQRQTSAESQELQGKEGEYGTGYSMVVQWPPRGM